MTTTARQSVLFVHQPNSFINEMSNLRQKNVTIFLRHYKGFEMPESSKRLRSRLLFIFMGMVFLAVVLVSARMAQAAPQAGKPPVYLIGFKKGVNIDKAVTDIAQANGLT